MSLLTMLMPVLLMLMGAVVTMAWKPSGPAARAVAFFSDPNIALGTAVLVGIVALGRRRGRPMEDVMKGMGGAVGSIAMVLFIIAGGGAFKQVLLDSGTAESIKAVAQTLEWSPIVLAWSTAAVLRLALGSATVAAITAAGVVLPLVSQSGVRPELMVLSTTAGSLMFSHFNDIGFFTYFGLQTNITIIDAAHPLAASLSGDVPVYEIPTSGCYGRTLGDGVIRVATMVGNPEHCTIFAYEAGAQMVGMAAPARRVGMFVFSAGTVIPYTPNVYALIEAAVNWAVGREPVSAPALEIALAGDSVQISWLESAAGFQLESTGSLLNDGPWTAVGELPVTQDGRSVVTLPLGACNKRNLATDHFRCANPNSQRKTTCDA